MMVWTLVTMLTLTIPLGYFLLNFQLMVESLLLEAIMIQYMFMIWKQKR